VSQFELNELLELVEGASISIEKPINLLTLQNESQADEQVRKEELVLK